MEHFIPPEKIKERIFLVRGKRVMLDSDLAKLYGVTTKALLQAVRRNALRFPSDFAYLLTTEEVVGLRSQFVTSKKGRGGRRTYPYVFTQEGVAMLSGILKSKRAIQVNIAIMRAFVKLRELMITQRELAEKMEGVERKLGEHDQNFKVVFAVLRKLLEVPEKPKPKIGFHAD